MNIDPSTKFGFDEKWISDTKQDSKSGQNTVSTYYIDIKGKQPNKSNKLLF